MVWSSWKSALAVALVGAGCAFGQQAPPAGGGPGGPRYVSLSESGRPPQQCEVLRCWRMAAGEKALQARAVDTGEIIVIVDPPSPAGEPAARRIYRWGDQQTAPAGFPAPPEGTEHDCDCFGHDLAAGQRIEPVAQPGPGEVVTGPDGVIVQGPCENCAPGVIVEGHPLAGGPCCEPGFVAGQRLLPAPGPGGAPLMQRLAGLRRNTSGAVVVVPPEPGAPPVFGPAEMASIPVPPADVPESGLGSRLKDRLGGMFRRDDRPAVADPAYAASTGAHPGTSPQGEWRQSWGADETPAVKSGARYEQVASYPRNAPAALKKDTAGKDQTAKSAVPFPGAKDDSPPLVSRLKSWQDGDPLKDPPLGKARDVVEAPPASRTAAAERPADPLSHPGHFAPDGVKKKLQLGEMATQGPLPPPGFGSGSPAAGTVPTGARSVIAANNGLSAPVKYVPYPVVTMPTPTHPPGPPAPQVPQPPQPAMYVNAFTPPGAGSQQQPQMPYPPRPMMPGMPMMPGGYPVPMYPGMMPMPQAARQLPQLPGYASRGYPGPQPPNPAQAANVTQVNYQPAGYPGAGYPQGMGAVPYANPAMDRPGLQVTQAPTQLPEQEAVYQLLTTLKTTVSPSQREWAAMNLCRYDWRRYPLIVDGMLTAAQDDPAATVRAACVTGLNRMQVPKHLIAGALDRLKGDVDPRVREAVQQVLGGDNAVQQTSARQPGAPAAQGPVAAPPGTASVQNP